MNQGHNELGEPWDRSPGAHPHLYAAEEIPRFKRKAQAVVPRYAWLLGLVWLVTFIGAALHFIQAIHGWDPNDWDVHHLGDGLVLVVTFIVTCLLWNAWEREERFPELLPRREFDRRYPPSSAAPPAPQREYHRRIPYVEDITPTGGYLDNPSSGDDRCG